MRAAAYARYSTEQQTDNSIATQLDAITKYCQRNGHEIVTVFTDEARSGTNTEREGFQRLIAGAAKKDFECVIIYDISRGSRNVVDWFTFREQMRALNIKVLSVTEQLGDISDPNTFLLELIGVGIGQHQVLQSRQKSIAGKIQKAKEGVFLGGFPPLGYDVVNRRYVINENEARAVRLIFDMYGEGKSYDHIVAAVNLLGIIGKRGRHIGKNSINSILNNDRYIGVYSWNRYNNRYMKNWCGGKATPEIATEIEKGIPAIIDSDTWDKVHNRMRERKHNAANTAKTEYLLSGKITCKNCGGAYFGKTNTNSRGVKTRYYTCGNKTRTKQCDAVNVNADILENIVREKVSAWANNLDLNRIAEEMVMIAKMRNSKKVTNVEMETLNRDILNIRHFISACENYDQRTTLIKQLASLETKRQEIAEKESAYSNKDYRINEYLDKLKKDISCTDEADIKRLVKEYVQKIYAYSDNIEIEIGVTIGGSTNKISLYNHDKEKQFAWFDGKVYTPRHQRKGQLLNRKERLWLFMTVRTAVEKRMMLHLEFVKHSSM